MFLDPKPGEFMIDGTANGGGHSAAILERIGPHGKLLAVDLDKSSEARFMTNVSGGTTRTSVIFKNDNYANIPKILKDASMGKADGLLLDLGFSSDELENGKGFSFQKDEPLDMRYGEAGMTVAELINGADEKELTDIIRKYGEEKYARTIAKNIVEHRRKKKIARTRELADIVKGAVPAQYERGRIHPATRTFQAFRIYVNHELENLEKILNMIPNILKQNGRVVAISFHSLEDRLVKNYFRNMKKNNTAEVLTKKPISAGADEIAQNPRARSAKLRALRIL